MQRLYWIAIAIFVFVAACTKIQSTNIGSGLIPPIDGVTTLDTTLEVITANYINPNADSVRVYKDDEHVIGVINNDPLFGKTTATAYFELKPTDYKFAFPGVASSLEADSAVLILSYRGCWGDTSLAQKWEIYELNEKIRPDSIYTTGTSFPKGNFLGSANIDITKLDDSVHAIGEDADNQIRLKLDNAVAQKFMKQYDSLPGHAYANDSLFRVNFKGFVVAPAAGSSGNALVRINLLDPNTKLGLYYRYKKTDSAAAKDTAVSYFRFSNNSITSPVPVSASGNYIHHEYTGSKFQEYATDNNSNDSLVFVQAYPGSLTTIKIPGLNALSNRIIHRAELRLLQLPDYGSSLDNNFTPPRFLLLSLYDTANRVKRNIPNDFIIQKSSPSAIIDRTEINTLTFGGFPVNRSIDGHNIKEYTFDLSRYVQGIVTRKDANNTLVLSAPTNDSIRYTPPYPANTTSNLYYITPSIANSVAIGRVMVGGGGTANGGSFRMRMRIIYSKI